MKYKISRPYLLISFSLALLVLFSCNNTVNKDIGKREFLSNPDQSEGVSETTDETLEPDSSYDEDSVQDSNEETVEIKQHWTRGSYDYFVMFKSLLENLDTVGEGGNPQADACTADQSAKKFTLSNDHLPDDAHIENAIVVWTGAVPVDKIEQPVKNSITLHFESSINDISLEKEFKTNNEGFVGYLQDFEFEWWEEIDTGIKRAYFSYRKDVTDFFNELHEEGRKQEIPLDGLSIVGDYSVSGVECTDEMTYLQKSVMVSGWALILVYSSEKITPKKIHLFNGFDRYWHEESEIEVGEFEFTESPTVRLTVMVVEGDPGIVVAQNPETGQAATPESLQIQPEYSDWAWLKLYNECNRLSEKEIIGETYYYTEVYNSISSVYGWDSFVPECIGGVPENMNSETIEHGIDVDTFVMNSSKDEEYRNYFIKGQQNMKIKIGANQDEIFSNFVIVSIDTKPASYDIPKNPNTPDGREKKYCSCSTDVDSICFDRPYYSYTKIENWGEDSAVNITISEEFSTQATYIEGTTEFATEFDEYGRGVNWQQIEDGADGEFPLLSPYKIADTLEACNPQNGSCAETIMIRYKLMPIDNLPKHAVILHSATINDHFDMQYRTNSNVPLRLGSGSCPLILECPEPDENECVW